MRPLIRVALGALAAACSAPAEPATEPPVLAALAPTIALPGTALLLTGHGFLAPPWGLTRLELRGSGAQGEVALSLPVQVRDERSARVVLDAAQHEALGGEGEFSGVAWVVVDEGGAGRGVSQEMPVQLALRRTLVPTLASMTDAPAIFVNDDLALAGTGLLLGGEEGQSVALVAGCVRRGSGCEPVAPLELPVRVDPRADDGRSRGSFRFVPALAGIRPGTFTGTVLLRNRHGGGAVHDSAPVAVTYRLSPPAVLNVAPRGASLGQRLVIGGGGFVAGDGEGQTRLRITGQYAAGGGAPRELSLELLPEFASGRRVYYALNEDDALGRMADLRNGTGLFTGRVTPLVEFRGERTSGTPASVELSLRPVRQVVVLDFTAGYVRALALFGLGAMDRWIRQRVLAAIERDYATINLEVRDEVPHDWAQYASVEISGADPNGIGLLGYDNSPGKDRGNQRLYDRIGGVNATTQEDGFPGYGGVFVESLLVFSTDPHGHARREPIADPLFDAIFDPFRPERGGLPVRARDFADGPFAPLASGEGCPARTRREQIRCAVWALGSLIGTTVSHELGHSLGLADPDGDRFHNPGDRPERLMDAGGARPFRERAEVAGASPGRFCSDEYRYLRRILPTDEPDDPVPRPPCD